MSVVQQLGVRIR